MHPRMALTTSTYHRPHRRTGAAQRLPTTFLAALAAVALGAAPARAATLIVVPIDYSIDVSITEELGTETVAT